MKSCESCGYQGDVDECPNCEGNMAAAPMVYQTPTLPLPEVEWRKLSPADVDMEEVDPEVLDAIHSGIRSLILLTTGSDVTPGMVDTPRRWVSAYLEMTSGYDEKAEEILSVIFEPGEGQPAYDEMVVLRKVSFTSVCEHHLLPFSGYATIAYVPGEAGKVVGISKLARLVEMFSRRFQLQERLTVQIAHALLKHLEAMAAACIIEATHQCMSCRGVKKGEARMVTSAMLGKFREDPAARAELLALAR